MTKLTILNQQGDAQMLEFTEGDTLMEVLIEAGFNEIQALCGGCCSCATCHVYIESNPELLADVEQSEKELLEFVDDYDKQRSRLSCQLSLQAQHDGLIVRLVG